MNRKSYEDRETEGTIMDEHDSVPDHAMHNRINEWDDPPQHQASNGSVAAFLILIFIAGLLFGHFII
jgi:hypothetical protein